MRGKQGAEGGGWCPWPFYDPPDLHFFFIFFGPLVNEKGKKKKKKKEWRRKRNGGRERERERERGKKGQRRCLGDNPVPPHRKPRAKARPDEMKEEALNTDKSS